MTAFSLESEWQGLYYPTTITKTLRIFKNVLSTLLNMQHSRMTSSQQQCEAGPLMSRFTDEGARLGTQTTQDTELQVAELKPPPPWPQRLRKACA